VVGRAGFGAPRIASTASEYTPSAAIIRSPVMVLPLRMVIEPASGSYLVNNDQVG
jgi:hypothetical protein